MDLRDEIKHLTISPKYDDFKLLKKYLKKKYLRRFQIKEKFSLNFNKCKEPLFILLMVLCEVIAF